MHEWRAQLGLLFWSDAAKNLIPSRAMNMPLQQAQISIRDAARPSTFGRLGGSGASRSGASAACRWGVFLSAWAVALVVLFAPAPSHALPGFFATKGGSATSGTTHVVLMMNDDEAVVSVATDYKGPAETFALVMPVPSDVKLEDVVTLKRHSIERLDELTAPRFHEFWEMDPCEQGKVEQIWERSLVASEASDFLGSSEMLKGTTKAPKEMRTKVEADYRDEGSEYKFSMTSSNVAGWLKSKGYSVPSGVDLAKYDGMNFLIAETDPQKAELGGKGEALLSAIRYSTKQDVKLPLTIGLANVEKMHELIIYTLHPSKRFETANYKTVFPPTNLQVDFQVKERIGEFYAGLHDMLLAKDPQAFVAEYAWPISGCGEPCVNASLRLDEILTLGADVFERSVPEQQRNPEPPARTEEEEAAYKEAKKDERKRLDELALEVARRKALMERHQDYVLSRLHHRYDAKGLPRDVEVKAAPPAEGGVQTPQGANGELPTDVKTGAAENKLQTRFVHLHPNKVAIKCDAPERYRWGKPPRTYRGARKIWTAQQLATRDRTRFKPQELVLSAYPALGLEGQKSAEEQAKAQAAGSEETDAKADSDCGCATVGRPSQRGSWLYAGVILVLAMAARRKR